MNSLNNCTLSKATVLQPRICSHMNYTTSTPDFQRALIYLKLLESGSKCTKSEAMQFASKNVCMSDSTLVYDGPAKNRVLKVKHKPNEITIKGWVNMGHEYVLGKNYDNIAKDLERAETTDMKKANAILSREPKQKVSFDSRMQTLNQHLKQTYEKYKITPQNNAKIKKKVA